MNPSLLNPWPFGLRFWDSVPASSELVSGHSPGGLGFRDYCRVGGLGLMGRAEGLGFIYMYIYIYIYCVRPFLLGGFRAKGLGLTGFRAEGLGLIGFRAEA